VKEVKGWYLQDFFDEKRGEGTFRARYEEVVADERIGRKVVKAIDMLKRIMVSQLETGNPFMFYRDEVNRMNPNKHQGMVYSSNLCTEILQNMSPTRVIQEMISGDQIVTTKQAGDFVVCNLSSVNLGSAVTAQPDLLSPDVLERLIRVQVRMLDNVIDLNDLPVPQATITNQKYRAIGLGTFGWHHLLAQKGIEARVVDMHTIKPLDVDCVKDCIDKIGKIITVEDHNILNGLGSAVCEVVAEEGKGIVKRIGVQDQFGQSAPYERLLAMNGITVEGIVEAAEKLQ
jgi:hypothetical protein